MKRKRMKHGVYVLQDIKFNTKKIYNRGHLMISYGAQPKKIDFDYPFINDTNQHYCGGWHLDGLDYSKVAQVRRVLDGLKPFTCLPIVGEPDFTKGAKKWVWGETQKKEKLDLETIVSFSKKVLSYGKFRGENDYRNIYDFYVCFDKTLGELVDLQRLETIYKENGIGVECVSKSSKHLSEYFSEWDINEAELWETGLILGYPIENTISLYKGAVR